MSGRRWSLITITLLVMAGAFPVSADQWYEHYARGEKALLDGDHATAIGELNQALERRGDSGARVRTYGMRVVDYFPYLKLGIDAVLSKRGNWTLGGSLSYLNATYDFDEVSGEGQGSIDLNPIIFSFGAGFRF